MRYLEVITFPFLSSLGQNRAWPWPFISKCHQTGAGAQKEHDELIGQSNQMLPEEYNPQPPKTAN